MTWLWAVPAAVALVGMSLLAALARRATDEAAALRSSLGAIAAIRPAVTALQAEVGDAADAVRRLREGREAPVR